MLDTNICIYAIKNRPAPVLTTPRSDSGVGHDYIQFYKNNAAPVRYDGDVDLQQ